MTRDDIIRMAQEAGIGVKKDLEDWHVPVWHLGIDYLVRFADLVAKRAVSNIDPASWMSYREGYAAGVADERKALVALVYEMDGPDGIVPTDDFLAAIRARSNT